MKKLSPYSWLIGSLGSALKLFFILFFLHGCASWRPQNQLVAGGNSKTTLSHPAQNQSAKELVVILDPGHGGEDKGAVGILVEKTGRKVKKRRLLEKDITLAIAIRVARVLANPTYASMLNHPIKVVFTRREDRTVSLAERSRLAQAQKAALFVSIHTNSDPTKRARGIETYFLNNTTDATDQKKEEIAKRGAAQDADPEITLLLKAVATDGVVGESRRAAEIVHESLREQLAQTAGLTHNRGVKQALLYVLVDAATPSILVESLFMTHQGDLKFLSEPENRQQIAEGIAMGILRYLVQLE